MCGKGVPEISKICVKCAGAEAKYPSNEIVRQKEWREQAMIDLQAAIERNQITTVGTADKEEAKGVVTDLIKKMQESGLDVAQGGYDSMITFAEASKRSDNEKQPVFIIPDYVADKPESKLEEDEPGLESLIKLGRSHGLKLVVSSVDNFENVQNLMREGNFVDDPDSELASEYLDFEKIVSDNTK